MDFATVAGSPAAEEHLGNGYDADVVAACERVFAKGFRFSDD